MSGETSVVIRIEISLMSEETASQTDSIVIGSLLNILIGNDPTNSESETGSVPIVSMTVPMNAVMVNESDAMVTVSGLSNEMPVIGSDLIPASSTLVLSLNGVSNVENGFLIDLSPQKTVQIRHEPTNVEIGFLIDKSHQMIFQMCQEPMNALIGFPIDVNPQMI
jgi:hypothetical protein